MQANLAEIRKDEAPARKVNDLQSSAKLTENAALASRAEAWEGPDKTIQETPTVRAASTEKFTPCDQKGTRPYPSPPDSDNSYSLLPKTRALA